MFNLNYNYIDADNNLINQYDNSSISILYFDSFESIDSKNSFLNNKTKPKTLKEGANQAFKKGKKFDELPAKIKNKDDVSQNNEKESKKFKIYRDFIFCKEISLEIIQNKKMICYNEKKIQTDSKYEDYEEYENNYLSNLFE